MDAGEFADLVEFEFDFDPLAVSRVVFPTDPSLAWNRRARNIVTAVKIIFTVIQVYSFKKN